MNYKVTADNCPVKVYKERIFPMPYNEFKEMECALFYMTDKSNIEIESEIDVKSVTVRPLSLGLEAKIDDGKIKISLDKPCKFSVEINGSYENNIVIFAEKKREPETSGRKIIRFTGVSETEVFDISEDRCTIIIEDDAVITGKLRVHDCEDVIIGGFGKIDMEAVDRDTEKTELWKALELTNCKNVTVQDIRISNSVSWSFRIMGCEDVNVDNVKIIGCRGNSDGIDVCGSRNINVRNIFTRTWDDSFVVKAFDTGDCENVTFLDSVLWNDFARPIEVGVELRADNVRNIKFKNIDIIHSPTGYPILGIHHGDRAKVRNICFEDIRIEDTPGAQIFDIRMAKAVWNKDPEMGDIDGVHLKNISYIGKPGIEFALSKSRIEGFDEKHCIKNVTLENISILGRYGAADEECGVNVMDFVENVNYICGSEERITPVFSVINAEEFEYKEGFYNGTVKLELNNPNHVKTSGRVWLQISPVNTAKVEKEIFIYEIEPMGYSEFEYKVTLQPGKYLFSIQSDNPDVQCDWVYKEFDMCLSKNSDIDDAPVMEFHNYYGDEAFLQIGADENGIIIKSDILKDLQNSIVLYGAVPVPDEDGQVKFSVEETDFGEVPAIMLGRHGMEAAPQLRCPAEITYVFKNEPKVKEICKYEVKSDTGYAAVPFDSLGITEDNFWLEIEAKIPQVSGYRYPFTLFHSVKPAEIAHMFVNVKIV